MLGIHMQKHINPQDDNPCEHFYSHVVRVVVVGVTCWELKSYLFKALVLPTFMYGTTNLGRQLEKLSLEGF